MFHHDRLTNEPEKRPLSLKQRQLVAFLEMAAEAEKLQRYPQAEHLYKRALVISRTAFGAYGPQSIAILWDLTRVCEKQNDSLRARAYIARATALGDASLTWMIYTHAA